LRVDFLGEGVNFVLDVFILSQNRSIVLFMSLFVLMRLLFLDSKEYRQLGYIFVKVFKLSRLSTILRVS